MTQETYPNVIYLVPYVCSKCNEILGPRTWNDSMPVGEVNEKCPRCGDNHIAIYGLKSPPTTETNAEYDGGEPGSDEQKD